jgi:uncharacterized membrane protein YkoI
MYRYPKPLFVALALASAVAGAVAAKNSVEDDTVAVAAAKIPLLQAVAMAEQYAKGRATHAAFENSRTGWVYGVEVASGAKVFDVRVDANSGVVLSSVEDHADGDQEQDD